MKRGPGAFFFFFSLIFLAVGAWTAEQQARAMRESQPVDAKVTAKQVDVKHDSDGNTYTPKVTYEYVVDGKPYHGDKVLPIDISSGGGWAKEIVDRFDVGGIATAYYDPADPTKAFLIHEVSFFPYVFILFPMIFTCIGLGVMFHRKGDAPTVPAIAWNLVGVAAAVHYFSIGGAMDLTAKVALMLYGLIGGLMLYVTFELKRGARW